MIGNTLRMTVDLLEACEPAPFLQLILLLTFSCVVAN